MITVCKKIKKQNLCHLCSITNFSLGYVLQSHVLQAISFYNTYYVHANQLQIKFAFIHHVLAGVNLHNFLAS